MFFFVEKLLNYSINNGDGTTYPFGEGFLVGKWMNISYGTIRIDDDNTLSTIVTIDDSVMDTQTTKLGF